ncbi:MAG: methyltransferase domain-containing protein [Desulfobacteraceae bacterium]|nr:methyltransferase domain-containing protein [Desulfobacteraceae bacterium]
MNQNRTVKENFFKTDDGTELFYRTWEPVSENFKKRAMIVLHRGHEHTGRLHDMIDKLDLPEFKAFGYDSRGHGRSPGIRGYAEDFSVLVNDLDQFVRYISNEYDIPTENIVIIANSVAGVLTGAWVHDYAPSVKAIVLIAPAFRIKLYVPFAMFFLRILNLIKEKSFISSYIKGRLLTHDKNLAESYDNDKLITKKIAVNILISLHDTATRIIDDAQAINVPTCILSSGSDMVVKNSPQSEFFNRISSREKEIHIFPGFFHGLFFEKERIKPISIAREFILNIYKKELNPVNLLDADQKGFTKYEYDLLKSKLPIRKKIFYNAVRLAMSTLGQLSKGIRVGYKFGFDSGVSLDHVYKNKPEGTLFLGKIIDFFYLNSVGWKGIRLRKINLIKSVEQVIEKLNNRNIPVRIMDIAGGPGRYLIEIAEKYKDTDIEILSCDNKKVNIEEGKKIADAGKISNIKFKISDAFSKESFEQENFSPNILIISGLFELFPSNDDIRKSLKAATSILQKNSYIIYTGQPWHPQI